MGPQNINAAELPALFREFEHPGIDQSNIDDVLKRMKAG